jgi:hypothetical protein
MCVNYEKVPIQMSESEIDEMTVNDYLFCVDCEEFVDWWKYRDLEDAGHEGHKVRNVTPEELKECVADCKETIDRCDEEGCEQRGSIVDSPEDREYHKGHKIIHESCIDEKFLYGPFKHEPLP